MSSKHGVLVVVLDMTRTFFLVLPHFRICRGSYEKLKFEHEHFFNPLSCPDVKSLVDNVDYLMKELLDKASADFEAKGTPASGSSAGACSTDHVVPHYQSRLKLDLPHSQEKC